ncbi:MAG TPA: peptidylprolyl isomerase [Saprospiraceae bacterium]|nr:peptidylprolyl isomerase [Saprospiraceae bacterium]
MKIRLNRAEIIWIFLLLGISFIVHAQEDPILLEVGDKKIPLSEFTYIYEKNHGDHADYSRQSVEEYLQLFVNFKLKVKKAKDLRYDTIPELIEELAGYRKQLAGSYLMEKELSERLIREMYERRQHDVRISHILFNVRRNAPESEWAEAMSKASKAMERLEGGEAFEKVAREVSEDENTSGQGGDLGYITAWLPTGFYYLENAAYTLAPGEISKPVRTRLGVHIIKVKDKRPAYGKIEVAHLLVRENPSDPDASLEKITRIHHLSLNGADFFELAKTLSDDRATSPNGGRLNPFGINTFDTTFENAAFALQNDGDVSLPVKTKAGWHLIKRLSKPEESFEEFRKRMKPQLPTLERYNNIKDILIEEIKNETGFYVNYPLLDSFSLTLDDQFFTYRWEPGTTSSEILISFDENQKFNLSDFVEFARKNARMRMKYNREKPPREALTLIFDEYSRQLIMDYEEKNLENKYADFRSLMREYEEGILLFEISKNIVWDKASTDTAGLRKFFNRNRENYFYTPEATLSIIKFVGSTDENIQEIIEYLEKNSTEKADAKFNKKRTAFEFSKEEINAEDPRIQNMVWKQGALSPLMEDESVMYKIEKIYPKKYKSLEESRGYVMANYQQELEELWVKELKDEYPVRINKEIIEKIIKS